MRCSVVASPIEEKEGEWLEYRFDVELLSDAAFLAASRHASPHSLSAAAVPLEASPRPGLMCASGESLAPRARTCLLICGNPWCWETIDVAADRPIDLIATARAVMATPDNAVTQAAITRLEQACSQGRVPFDLFDTTLRVLALEADLAAVAEAALLPDELFSCG